MTIFNHYLKQEAMFLERGLVVSVRIKAVTPCFFEDNTGADFELLALRFLQVPQSKAYVLPFDSNGTLEVGSVFLKDHNQIVVASGYVNWVLIFNEGAKRRILNELPELNNLYRKSRKIADETFYEDAR